MFRHRHRPHRGGDRPQQRLCAAAQIQFRHGRGIRDARRPGAAADPAAPDRRAERAGASPPSAARKSGRCIARAAELGGDLRTGLEDTIYLPDGARAASNGELIAALAAVARAAGPRHRLAGGSARGFGACHQTRRRGHDGAFLRRGSAEPVLQARARSVPRLAAPICQQGNRALRQPMGRGRRVSARALSKGRRHRLHGARLSRTIWRDRRRPLHAHHRHAGNRPRRLRRRRRRPVQPHHRRAADPASRLRGDEGPRAAADPVGRENLGARDHRALGRFRRRQPAHHRAARRRPFRRQRLQDLHHLGDARRFHHARRAHRRPRRRRASASS